MVIHSMSIHIVKKSKKKACFFLSSKWHEIISVERGKIADSEYVVICERCCNKLYVRCEKKMNNLFEWG